jgi:Tol biopolymer transport system component
VIVLPAGAGQARTLSKGWEQGAGSFFPDGNRVLFYALKAGAKERVYVQDIVGGEPKVVSPDGVYFADYSANQISPDGKWFIAYDDANGYRLYPVQGGEPREILGIQPGEGPLRWNANGSAIFMETGIPSRVYLLDPFTGRRQFWKELMPPDPVGVHYVGLVFTPDGKTYAYAYYRTLSDLYVIEGLK